MPERAKTFEKMAEQAERAAWETTDESCRQSIRFIARAYKRLAASVRERGQLVMDLSSEAPE